VDRTSLTRLVFKRREDVASQLSDLPEAEQIETVRQMLTFCRSTYEVAKEVMPELRLDARMDLIELACRPDPSFDTHLQIRIPPRPIEERPVLTGELIAALKAMNVERADYGDFLAGQAVACAVRTRSGEMIDGFLMLKADCLASAIFMIHDPGDGLAAFSIFRARTYELARAAGKSDVEFIGAAISNKRLGQVLINLGFELSTVDVPLAFGAGEQMEILSKRFPVRS
jgi:hypothetical protein